MLPAHRQSPSIWISHSVVCRFAVVTIPLLFAGCSSNSIDPIKFEKLKIGMTSQEVEAILGKDGKPIPSDEVAKLLREALNPKGGAGPKIELPDISSARGTRWGDDKKSITVIYVSDRVSRIFKKGF